MITNKIISNKFYKFGNDIVKIVKILKSQNKLVLVNLSNMEQSSMPFEQADLVLHRIYTIGEVSKIVNKRSDTIRKYEKNNLIPQSKKFGDKCVSYKNWRYYDTQDVYDMVAFFSGRIPGRPINNKTVRQRIISIEQQVKLRRN
jgi:hypothetical protein